MILCHGPEGASHLVVLAPGDEGHLTDTAPTAIAEGLAAAGIRVARFAAPGGLDEASRDGLMAGQIRAAVAATAHQVLVLGGLSRGARVSTSLVAELGAVGWLGFAFPFHPRHDPDPGERAAQLGRLPVPALLCQGTRDSLGNRQQVLGYRLPAHIRVHWLEEANHALEPRPRSAHTQAAQLAEAAAEAARFILAL